MKGKAPALIVLLSAVSLFFGVPQPVRFICGFAQMFVLPGMIFSYLLLGAGFTRADRSFFAILISPVIISLSLVAVTSLTGDMHASIRIALAVFYLLLVGIVLLSRKERTEEERAALPRQVLAVASLFAGVILVSYLLNTFLLLRSDAWYHASVVNEIGNRGVPPHEPWLADLPINYMWIYHLFNAAFKEIAGIPVFWAMGIFNVAAALVFPYIIARYISCFTAERRRIVFASILAVAGLESASWIFVPIGFLRAFFGEVRGGIEVQRMLSALNFNGASVIHSLTPYGAWMVNLYDKFITITAFSYSLNLFMAALVIALNREFLRDSRWKWFAALFILCLGTILFHAVTGTALVMTMVGAGLLALVFGRYLTGDVSGLEGGCLHMAAAVLAAALGLPYVLSLGTQSGGEGGTLISQYLQLGVRSALTIALPLLVLFVPARQALRRLVGKRDNQSVMVLCWSASLLIIALSVNLPTVNESKLIFPLFLVIGPQIYMELAQKIRNSYGIRRGLTIVAVAVLFLVPLSLTFRGFLIQKPDSDLLTRRTSITAEDRRLFEWIRENTSHDSVIMENNDYHLVPVFAGRRNFYSNQGVIRVLGYDAGKMEQLERIQSSVYGRVGFSEDTAREMLGIGPALYIALWRDDVEARPWLSGRFSEESRYFRRVYAGEAVSLYVLRD